MSRTIAIRLDKFTVTEIHRGFSDHDIFRFLHKCCQVACSRCVNAWNRKQLETGPETINFKRLFLYFLEVSLEEII